MRGWKMRVPYAASSSASSYDSDTTGCASGTMPGSAVITPDTSVLTTTASAASAAPSSVAV